MILESLISFCTCLRGSRLSSFFSLLLTSFSSLFLTSFSSTLRSFGRISSFDSLLSDWSLDSLFPLSWRLDFSFSFSLSLRSFLDFSSVSFLEWDEVDGSSGLVLRLDLGGGLLLDDFFFLSVRLGEVVLALSSLRVGVRRILCRVSRRSSSLPSIAFWIDSRSFLWSTGFLT